MEKVIREITTQAGKLGALLSKKVDLVDPVETPSVAARGMAKIERVIRQKYAGRDSRRYIFEVEDLVAPAAIFFDLPGSSKKDFVVLPDSSFLTAFPALRELPESETLQGKYKYLGGRDNVLELPELEAHVHKRLTLDLVSWINDSKVPFPSRIHMIDSRPRASELRFKARVIPGIPEGEV